MKNEIKAVWATVGMLVGFGIFLFVGFHFQTLLGAILGTVLMLILTIIIGIYLAFLEMFED